MRCFSAWLMQERMPCLASLGFAALLLAPTLAAQDTAFPPKDGLIPVPDCLGVPEITLNSIPCTPEQLLAWRQDVRHWRDEDRIRMGYDDREYRRPALQWAQSSFMQPQMMVEDRYFYDNATGKYTVDRYLDDLQRRIGGIDSVLVWQSYPNIGVDNRNQYDLVRALPGGIPALRDMVQQFHRRGVHVLFPVMLWDQGTRDEGIPDWEATAQLMAAIGADGINGDTLGGVPRAFRVASDKTGNPLVLEPEGQPTHDEMLAYNNMSWGYWRYPFTPLLSQVKLIEPRHMVNISDRWNRSKIDNLQSAFFNGVGLETWENVWSIWNGFTPRDAEAIRRVGAVDRAVAPFLISQDWEPLTPTLQFGVFASKWPLAAESVYTLVNRNEYNLTGPQLKVTYAEGMHYYDLWHGIELHGKRDGADVLLDFDMEGKGFGAILATPRLNNAAVEALLQKAAAWSKTSLAFLSNEWVPLPQHIVATLKTHAAKTQPVGMVKVPAADFLFNVDGIELEGFNGAGVDVQYPWEDAPRRHHVHTIKIAAFWMDTHPVTNSEFRAFLKATRYRPQDDFNFLRDWVNGSYPQGWGNKPVTWVSHQDAEAYAGWAGKRLPHEWEWQYAAQGRDHRTYPWGDGWDATKVPAADKERTMRGPDDADAHPQGASPFGVLDLVGNVWQWTDVFEDEHTQTAVLRGGSYYQPQGSMWYFPQAYRNTTHGKLLMMAPSKDRSGAVGFRCVVDAE